VLIGTSGFSCSSANFNHVCAMCVRKRASSRATSSEQASRIRVPGVDIFRVLTIEREINGLPPDKRVAARQERSPSVFRNQERSGAIAQKLADDLARALA
jgi:hypothetical protein